MNSCTSRQCFGEDMGQGKLFGQANHQAGFPGSYSGFTSYTGDESKIAYKPVGKGTETGHELSTTIHHKPRVTKDAFVNVQTSMAIVFGLIMGIAVSGFFAEVPAPPEDANEFFQVLHDFRLMIWCVSLFAALMSTACSVYSINQAGFMETDDQMNAYLGELDAQWLGGQTTLNLLVLVPFIFMMIAIPQHMFLSHHEHQTNHTYICLGMCLFLCPMPPAIWFFFISHKAFKASLQPAPSTLSETEETTANMMYTALQEYLEHKGSIFAMQRKEFLQHFGHGEVERELAGMIFDDWKQKRMKSMLREDPGF